MSPGGIIIRKTREEKNRIHYLSGKQRRFCFKYELNLSFGKYSCNPTNVTKLDMKRQIYTDL